MGKQSGSEVELASLSACDGGFQQAALEKGGPHLEQRRLSWTGCTAILATYNVSASTAFMPFIFGRLGYAVAPVLLGLYIALCSWLNHQVILMMFSLPHLQSLPELGGALAGPAGRKAFMFLQVVNQQCFMPCAMLLVIKSLKQVVLPASEDGFVHPSLAPGLLSCNVVWIIFGAFAFLLVVNVQRRFTHASRLCKVTCAINVLLVACLTARVTDNWADFRGKPHAHSSRPELGGAPEPWFPLPVTNEVHERSYWLDLLIAMSSMAYAYTPIFIATEVMQELKVTWDARRALWSSTAIVYVFFIVSGLLPVLAWGWNRKYEVLTELQADLYGRSANFLLMLGCAVDFTLTAISLNQFLQEAAHPGFDVNDWSARACFRWFLLSLPTLVVSVLMLCLVPRLHSLVGLLSAFVIPFTQLIGPATLTTLAARRGLLGRQLGFLDCFALLISFATGIAMVAAAGTATIYGILMQGAFEGDFFCERVAG